MGQYYYIINLDKKQYLDPSKFGDGLKLLEFGCSEFGTLTGLTILLAKGNGEGAGDLHSKNHIIGTWAGDRIAIIGDYSSEIVDFEKNYKDISEETVKALMDDFYIKRELKPKIDRLSDPFISL